MSVFLSRCGTVRGTILAETKDRFAVLWPDGLYSAPKLSLCTKTKRGWRFGSEPFLNAKYMPHLRINVYPAVVIGWQGLNILESDDATTFGCQSFGKRLAIRCIHGWKFGDINPTTKQTARHNLIRAAFLAGQRGRIISKESALSLQKTVAKTVE